MKLTQKAKGEKIITQGSYGNSFYVLDSGQCTVTKVSITCLTLIVFSLKIFIL